MSEDVDIREYEFEIETEPNIDRLDAYLAEHFSDYSRSFIKKLMDEGGILVNAEPVKPSYTPKSGDVVVAHVPVQTGDPVQPEDIDLDVVYEDEWIIAVNKPWDMVVHPSKGHQSGTLVNAVAYHCEHLSEYSGELRPGVVHRLDRDTTGVILMIKDDQVHREIARQFADREIHKEYIAICEGRVELDSDIIEARIGNHRRYHEKMAIRPDRGKRARTTYEVVERLQNFTIVRCKPETGRTHQIRVHMHHIGHPVVCDANYGVRKAIYKSDLTGCEHYPSDKPLMSRQALHARRITFYHPVRETEMTIEASIPPDMMRLVNTLRELEDQERASIK